MPLRTGETFAGYRILGVLGSGGMGEVYLAQHPRLPRHDALKVLRPDVSRDSSFRERFIREADLAARLRHPYIVGIHDRGEHDGQLWLTMDYIEGTDAARLLETRYRGGLPTDLAVQIITAVASALDYAHKQGLLHRDVKPANIIVADLDTDEPSAFLADFGIARPLDDTSGLTSTNMTVGTVAYAAPEQLMGETIDGRADQYALAATAYHLLAGSPLFPNSNPAVVISRHLNGEPPRLADHRPDLAGLDVVLMGALAKDPGERYSSCSAFARTLERGVRGEVAAPDAVTQAAFRPGTPADETAPAPSVKSRRAWTAAGGAAAIALLAGGIMLVGRSAETSDSAEVTAATSSASAATAVPTPAPTTPARARSSPSAEPLPLPTTARTLPEQPVTTAVPSAPSISPVDEIPPDEQGFLTAARTLPMYVIPNGRYATDADVIASGYQACSALDRYPNDSMRATRAFYPSGNQVDGQITYYGQLFMVFAANHLCQRHAHLYENF